jgi:hypothetical protein
LPEKPPLFAYHLIGLAALLGGIGAVFVVGVTLDPDAFETGYVALVAPFGVGAVVGAIVGWRWVMPSGRP